MRQERRRGKIFWLIFQFFTFSSFSSIPFACDPHICVSHPTYHACFVLFTFFFIFFVIHKFAMDYQIHLEAFDICTTWNVLKCIRIESRYKPHTYVYIRTCESIKYVFPIFCLAPMKWEKRMILVEETKKHSSGEWNEGEKPNHLKTYDFYGEMWIVMLVMFRWIYDAYNATMLICVQLLHTVGLLVTDIEAYSGATTTTTKANSYKPPNRFCRCCIFFLVWIITIKSKIVDATIYVTLVKLETQWYAYLNPRVCTPFHQWKMPYFSIYDLDEKAANKKKLSTRRTVHGLS